MSKSFLSSWIVYAAISHAAKSGLFKGQKNLARQAQLQIKRMASPRTAFGRQLKLLHSLRGKPATTMELCRSTGVSRRTLFRDLAALRAAGVKVVSDGTRFALKDKMLRAALGKLA